MSKVRGFKPDFSVCQPAFASQLLGAVVGYRHLYVFPPTQLCQYPAGKQFDWLLTGPEPESLARGRKNQFRVDSCLISIHSDLLCI
jgi:hypothetical protein